MKVQYYWQKLKTIPGLPQKKHSHEPEPKKLSETQIF